MRTLAIRDGDLVLEAGGFKLLDGPAKTHQDLTHGVSEPYGVDRHHPRWGSILPEMVGQAAGPETELYVTSEITRVVQNLAAVQADVLERDRAAGRRPRFGTGELIRGLGQIRVARSYDRLRVRATVFTLSGEQLSLDRTVTA